MEKAYMRFWWSCCILAALAVVCGCHSSMSSGKGSCKVRFSDGDDMAVSYYPDGLPMIMSRFDSSGNMCQICFFDFYGGIRLDQDQEGVINLPERPGDFYSKCIKNGAPIPQSMPLTFESEEAHRQYALEGRYYVDDDGGVNVCVWAIDRDGALDKVVLRSVLNRNRADAPWEVKIVSRREFGKKLSLKDAHVDANNFVLEYAIKQQNGDHVILIGRLPINKTVAKPHED